MHRALGMVDETVHTNSFIFALYYSSEAPLLQPERPVTGTTLTTVPI